MERGRIGFAASGAMLTPGRQTRTSPGSDGRTAAGGNAGGKSGLHGNTVPANGRRGRPQGKCHRKQTARLWRASARRVRVKGCGKSAPRLRQRRWQGKPHREQDRIGVAGASQGHSRSAARVGRVRRIVRCVPEEWPSRAARRGQNPAYRPSGAFTRGNRGRDRAARSLPRARRGAARGARAA